MAEQTTQILREAPEIEAAKLGLLSSAKTLADEGRTIPPYMVAEMDALQIRAEDLAKAGIGGYQPFLEQAGFTLGDAQTALGRVMSDAAPFQAEAAMQIREGLFNVPGAIYPAVFDSANAYTIAQQAAQRADDPGRVSTLETQLGTADLAARGLASRLGQDALTQAGTIQTGLDAATLAAQQAAATGQTSLGTAAGLGQAAATQAGADTAAAIQAARGAVQGAGTGLQQAGAGALQTAQGSGLATQGAITGARGLTSDAATALRAAGALGSQAAQQGIAGLAGTTGAFDPTASDPFMNRFEDAAVQQALADIRRAGDIQQQQVGAQAAAAGAFGGSRQAIAEQELQRNILEQQARTAAGMRQQGFESAAQRAQQAFESQQARAQQAAQLSGSLGAQGAQSEMQAAQLAGQLGLSAEELAGRLIGQQAQTGLSAQQLFAQTAQQSGQLGLSAEQLAAQTAQQQGQTGLSAAQLRGQLAGQAADLGMNAAQMQQLAAQQGGQLGLAALEQAGQIGLSAEQLASANAQALANTGMNLQQLASQTGLSQAQLAGQLGQQTAGIAMQGAEVRGRLGEGLGALGTQYGQLGLQQGEGLGQLGLRQSALGELQHELGQRESGFLFDLGKQRQAQAQAGLDATRQTQVEQQAEPFERIGFLSDVYKGAPSSQMSITQQSGGSISPAQSILGLGIAGLSAAAGANRAGLF